MAKLGAFLLCDFAQVREGLLFVASGGITQVRSRTLPLCAAVVVALAPDDLGQPMELRLVLKRVETAERRRDHRRLPGRRGQRTAAG